MQVLAFDPGHLTGIAAFNDRGMWTMGLTVTSELLGDSLFTSLVKVVKPTVVVIENLPTYRADKETLENSSRISDWFKTAGFEVVSVNPGMWKGMIGREKISGTHQMDAATMGKWYIYRGSKHG